MLARPQLMVLYTNNAVEVRYTNGDRLHVLPCGSGFIYCKSQNDAHPANGLEMIQQRCRYVTSTYRHLLLSALDFRNRFSERPYLCEELLESDQVVHLYARIKEIAWPKVLSAENTEVMEDGSVCITSLDEFACLILSAHRRDFTVCYLSELSDEKHREKVKTKKTDQRNSQNTRMNNKHTERQVTLNSMPDVVPRKMTEYSSVECQSTGNTNSSPARQRKDGGDAWQEDLNISPITQASCTDSPQSVSNASGSPCTPQNTVKDREAKFRPFSTPTDGLEDTESPVCTPYGNTAVFNDYGDAKVKDCFPYTQTENVDGSFLGEHVMHNPSKKDARQERALSDGEKSLGVKGVKMRYSTDVGHELMSDLGNVTITAPESVRSDVSETRYKYCWLTLHISSDECPVRWSQTVKMAQQVAENGCIAQQELHAHTKRGKSTKATASGSLREINKAHCIMSEVPKPLPLSCPGQHLHKMHSKKTYDDGKDPLEDPTTFAQGRLKVLLVDGVIYRIVRHPTIKMIEVYPGDGSVLVSQGPSAHFFLHVIPHRDKLEERTYSVKSPPSSTKGSYSIKNLISRAHRFLGYVRHEENSLPASIGICCWKYEESVVMEPMSTTVLEECEIHGYGKFTALSNGQIRIAFKDRTCLDMTCDFSRRLQHCLDHSSDSLSQQTAVRMLTDKKAGTCRLLLPNGQYQMIDIDHPGIYKRYIDAAKEWADWVNSSPTQRQKFYTDRPDHNMKMSVERELQKIQCFNYVVDNTVLKKPESDSINMSEAFKPHSVSEQRRPSILRNPEQGSNRKCDVVQHSATRTVQIHSPPLSYSVPSMGSVCNSVTVSSVSSDNIGVNRILSTAQNKGRDLRLQTLKLDSIPKGPVHSSLEGFNSVREALLRTSSAIKDIDKFLDKQ